MPHNDPGLRALDTSMRSPVASLLARVTDESHSTPEGFHIAPRNPDGFGEKRGGRNRR